MTQSLYESPTESHANSGTRSFSIRPGRWTAFGAVLVLSLVAGLFVPTIELFKGTVSLGRAPLWYAYVGLAVRESWPLPFLLIGAHWIAALTVAWIVDRLLGDVLQPRS